MIFLESVFHMWPGNLGHFLVLLSLVSAITASVSYFLATQQESVSWKKLGRITFGIHGFGVVGIFIIIFFLLINRYYEYYYAWQHASNELPLRYLASSFWEGQEGSFLLWSFWHVVLGGILIFRAKKWEAPVLFVISVVEAFVASMLVGIYFGEYRLGNSPFALLRDAMANAPIFTMNPDYIPEDGTGLNPLLQNYWMTIHPPTLFLGFASTIVPFAYAIASLWKKQYQDWVKPVLPWVLFSVAVLGTGIMMGGAWAYEALSFGGFWAWDPVENASLVPWLVMVAGLHTLLVYKSTGQSLRSTYLFFILSFFLILYSTFLTRSGVLGDSSVHSFTDLGMSGQLLVYMLSISIPAFGLFFSRYKNIPFPPKEEDTSSREFWMFVGAIVILLSSVQITFSTSIPVINKVLGTNMAPPSDPVSFYNQWQLPIAIIMALLTAFSQFFKYKKTAVKSFLKSQIIPFTSAVIVAVPIVVFYKFYAVYFILFVLFAAYTTVANLFYIVTVLKSNFKFSGGSISHAGFGLMLLGILISQGRKEAISINRLGYDYGEGFDSKANRENILLSKGMPMQMGDYFVTYEGDSIAEPNNFYKVSYQKVDAATQQVKERFTLKPYVQENPRMGDVANPDTRHYWNKDIYTHVSAVRKVTEEDKHQHETYKVSMGDTVSLNKKYIIIKALSPSPKNTNYQAQEGDVAIGAKLSLVTIDSTYSLEPIYFIRDNYEYKVPDQLSEQKIQVELSKIFPEENKMELTIDYEDELPEYIIMKAIVFPHINVLWMGLIVMVIGILLSMYRRYSENK